MKQLRRRRAAQAATKLLRRYGASDSVPVPIEEIAHAHGVRIESGPLDGALALLARVGSSVRMRVSDRTTHPGQRRFSIAHELGHLVLAHDCALAVCTRRAMQGLDDDLDIEAEANAFAANALLPEGLLRSRCEVSPVNLDIPRAMAVDFNASLVASTIRFVELSSERCAVVLSEKRRVRWAVSSKTFWPYIKRGQHINAASVAHEHYATRQMPTSCEPIDASAWVDGTEFRGDAEIYEHAVVLDALDAVLSLVWIPESCTALTYRDQ